MDPISTTFIAINAAALLIRISSLIRLLRKVQNFEEPTLDRIRIGLLTEHTQFKVWCHQTGVNEGGLDHIQSRLPPDALNAAVVIVGAFQKWMDNSVILLHKRGIKLDSQNIIGEPLRTKDLGTLAKRLTWRLYGYKDLDEMLKTLHALNNGLQIICKPILSYDDDRINELIKSVDNLVTRLPSYTQSIETQVPDTSLQSPRRSSGKHIQEPHPLGKTIHTLAKPKTLPSVGNIKANAKSFPSEMVFKECLKLLRATFAELETQSEYKHFATQLRSAHMRMKIWGCCVFEIPLHLDQIMTKGHEDQNLRSSVIGILADLTLTVENFCEKLVTSKSSITPDILLRSQIVFGIHEEVFEHSLDLPDEAYEYSDTIGEAVMGYVDEVVGLVDCLYQTIPFVRRMQDVHYLELNSKASNFISDIKSEGVSIGEPEFQERDDKASFKVQNFGSHGSPIPMVVDTTAEMMKAIQLSIKEAQEQYTISVADSLAFDDAMKQIEEWDKQIETMKAWSNTFNSLSQDQDSPEVVEHNIKIIQNLATMACDIASTFPSKDNFPFEMLKPQIARLGKQLPASDRARFENVTQDIKIKEESKTLAEAFQTVQFANKAIKDEVDQLAAFKLKSKRPEYVMHAIPVS